MKEYSVSRDRWGNVSLLTEKQTVMSRHEERVRSDKPVREVVFNGTDVMDP